MTLGGSLPQLPCVIVEAPFFTPMEVFRALSPTVAGSQLFISLFCGPDVGGGRGISHRQVPSNDMSHVPCSALSVSSQKVQPRKYPSLVVQLTVLQISYVDM